MASLGTDIADYLKEYHTTENYAIKGRELCTLFNLHDKQVRNIVGALRQDGYPICSSTNGYWYSENIADIEKTVRRIESQIVQMTGAVKGLRGCIKEDL